MLPKEYPDHHDADLVLRLYDMRRETVLRESRAALNAKYWPKTADDAMAPMQGDHPLNAAFRQVTTYWEMVYGMVKWGVLHAEFMMESNSEGLLLFAKARAYLTEIRARGGPHYFANAEWIATRTEAGKRAADRYGERVKKTLETR